MFYICWLGQSFSIFSMGEKLEKILILGKIEGRRRRGRHRIRWLDGITDLMDTSFIKLWDGDGQRSLVCCGPWGLKELDINE